jgi:acetyl esterase/lipase
MSQAQVIKELSLPGRLGDPNRTLKTDPRIDPRLAAALAPFGMDGPPPPAPVGVDSPLKAKLEHLAATEAAMQSIFAGFVADLPPIPNIERRTETIRGQDGNEITLYIHQPQNAAGPLPCVYHTHGGGMVMLTAADAVYRRWRDELAQAGLVVVGVEFRNGGGKLGNHPFPAGLNDCVAGLQWTFDNKNKLGISRIILSGESGGGNLALATCLRAKREGRLNQIAGVYALCPYIYGAWEQPGKELVSLVENDGYLIDVKTTPVLAAAYDPDRKHGANPLAWPYRATVEELRGLPPHVISVNELDPLRDEGLVYHRRLRAAGVPGYSRTVNGTIHAADVLFPKVIREVSDATIRDIKGFADSL